MNVPITFSRNSTDLEIPNSFAVGAFQADAQGDAPCKTLSKAF